MTTSDIETQEESPALDDAAKAVIFTAARSASNFTDQPVSDELLREIYELAKFGPTSANLLPGRIVYVTTPEGKARILPHLSPGNVDKTAAAPVTAILAVDNHYERHVPKVFPVRPEMQAALENDEALHDKLRDFSGTLQAAYFIIAARAVGLAAGPMGGFDGPALDKELFPDGDWSTRLVVNLGYPGDDAWFDRLPRLDYEEAVRHI